MAVNAAQSGKAPPGRLSSGAATMALATTFPVTACGSEADNSAEPTAVGPQSAHVSERFLDLGTAGPYTPVPPEDARSDEYRCQMIDPVSDQGGVPDRDPIRTGERRHRAPRHRAPRLRVHGAAGRRCLAARAGREGPGLGCSVSAGPTWPRRRGRGARRGSTPVRAW
jgi:hypothetical protein